MLRKEEKSLQTAINKIIHEIKEEKNLQRLENKWKIESHGFS